MDGMTIALLAGGFVLLLLGAELLVRGASRLAAAVGVTPLVIGLTIVAAGTSLPEVFTSLMATLRNERDIAIGNVVGSNIYNILMIIGVSSLITPDGLNVAPSLINFSLPITFFVMVAWLWAKIGLFSFFARNTVSSVLESSAASITSTT